MANEEHLAILKQGVKAWNQWRKEHPGTRPDLCEVDHIRADLIRANLRGARLSGVDLSVTDLREADLHWANLSGAHLSRAILSGADLSRAILSEANLSEADLHGANLFNAHLSSATLIRGNLSEADLRGADLRGADLSGADLSRAYLRMADLSRANLREANLNGAYLSRAILSGANLSEADLREANLSRAYLSRAILSGADLIEADLREANLSGANVERARVGQSVFGDVDLSVVKGLDTVEHQGPSTVGIDTIYKSKGKIPEVFLRGCGVPDNFVAYIGSLVGKPIEYYSCFISYSSKDQECAERLHNDLQAKGVRCWFAPEDLKIGDKFRTRIDEAIRIHDKLLLVLSEHSVNSKWVESEVEAAFDKETSDHTVLFPIRLDDTVMQADQAWAKEIRRTRHIGDLTCWKDHDAYQKAFDRLLYDLKAESAEATE